MTLQKTFRPLFSGHSVHNKKFHQLDEGFKSNILVWIRLCTLLCLMPSNLCLGRIVPSGFSLINVITVTLSLPHSHKFNIGLDLVAPDPGRARASICFWRLCLN